MERIVSVRLRDTGQSFLYRALDIDVKEGMYVIVEHDRGLDYGQIVSMKPQGSHPPDAAGDETPGQVSAQDPQTVPGASGCPGCPMQGIPSDDHQASGSGDPAAEPPAQEAAQAGAGHPQHEEAAPARPGSAPIKRIIRIARESDLKQIEDNRLRSKEAFGTCQKKITEHKLDMKLVQAEYSFDRSKIIFYFTSGGRVDFRNLVKDLAKIFKARIELRQIGVRDETKFFGGFGPCGRELCCASFLKDFEPVTIKMAKEEGLPLNPPKISGICGRLMCCLYYEYDMYKSMAKGLPREGERISTNEGKGKVISVNVFKRTATVELEDGKTIELAYKEGKDQKPERCDRYEQYERHERQERPERQEKPERQDRPDRQQRQERPQPRPDRQERPDRRDRNDRRRPGDRQERRDNKR